MKMLEDADRAGDDRQQPGGKLGCAESHGSLL
jgi:hypothetical protein